MKKATKVKPKKQDIIPAKFDKAPEQPPAPETKLKVIDSKTALELRQNFTTQQIELMKNTIARNTTDTEFAWFLYVAKARRLDPLQRQIHCVKRKVFNKETKDYDEVMTIQVGIDGFRSIANRTNLYMPSPHQAVVDTTDKGVLIAVTFFVLKWSPHDHMYHEFSGTARLNEYIQLYRDGNEWKPAGRWAYAATDQLEKCAEAKALRRGWPEELGDFYAPEELDHVQNHNPVAPRGKAEVAPPKSEETAKPKPEGKAKTEPEPKTKPESNIRKSEEPNRGHGNEGTQYDQRQGVKPPSRADLRKMLDDTMNALWPDVKNHAQYRAIAGKTCFGAETKNQLEKIAIADLMAGVFALKIFQAEIQQTKQMPLTEEALGNHLFNCLTSAKERMETEKGQS